MQSISPSNLLPKTVVCIIEEEMIINYLFVKEIITDKDSLLLISQHLHLPLAAHFEKLFPDIASIHILPLHKDGDEDLWGTICTTLREKLPNIPVPPRYFVNLSGGTRLLSSAVQQVFEPLNGKFFFLPLDRNILVHSQLEEEASLYTDITSKIAHRLTVEEYLKVHGIASHSRAPIMDKHYTEHFYTLFSQNHLSQHDHDCLDYLRGYRNKNIAVNKVKGLEKLLRFIDFPATHPHQLSAYEVQYLTGSWFEEYMYHFIKEAIHPCDLAMSVTIQREGSASQNELDVVFTLQNRLFVIECKTGVGRAGLYHQMVYKASALRESLLGLRSNAYIFSLNHDHENHLARTALNMGITFCDQSYTNNPERLLSLFRKMAK